eukprot:gene4956-5759_t
MSYNIRYDSPNDGDHMWIYRKPMVSSAIQFAKPLVIGFQECMHNQIEDLLMLLGGKYSYKIEYIHGGQFWISEDAYKAGSKSWGTFCSRLATWGQFKHIKTGRLFYFLNTHLDHISDEARSEDFNAYEDTQPIANILASQSPAMAHKYLDLLKIPISQSFAFQRFRNAKDIAHYKLGPKKTFTGFKLEFAHTIDYVFVNEKFAVHTHTVLNNTTEPNAVLASDHFPVIADLTFVD